MKKTLYKILIVDDIEENLQVVGSILDEQDIAILFAKSGKQAIKIATKKLPDLILLDINMPEMNGYETCDNLKNNELTKEIPIIFLSAYNQKDDIVKGFDYGGVDYITKPFNKAELISRVFTHLDLKNSRDIIKKQNETLKNQNNKIHEQHESIMSSIHYAKKIQDAVLPSDNFLNQFLPDNFTLYIPKDVVSGDFYWTSQFQNKVIIAAADCTGHGVPGAFMSMLGVAYLSEIFNSLDYTSNIKADYILNTLRKRIKIALHQDRRKNTTSDGMDMALCIINIETKTMDYAGANNPLFLIRNNETTNEKELLEYKPDKMPVSVHLKEKPFVNNEIQLRTNDIIYLFSDGYCDQFGGEFDRKFKRAQFKNLLIDNSSKPMKEQKEIILNRFFEWKGNKEQVDDVMIIGIKIPETYGDVDMF